jgi:molybdenum ABC transporter molybdate-binding protein
MKASAICHYVLSFVTAATLLGPIPVHAQTKDILVFGAASLKNALDDANAAYLRQANKKVVVSYGASSALARQIESGAPADLFISADLDWMDYVAQRNLIKPATRSNFLGNKLVLVAPVDSKVSLTIGRNFPLAAALGGGRLGLADPSAVPAGKYAKAALEALGVWSSVADKIAPAPDVRAALVLVRRRLASSIKLTQPPTKRSRPSGHSRPTPIHRSSIRSQSLQAPAIPTLCPTWHS